MTHTFPNALGQQISTPVPAFSGCAFPKPRNLVGKYCLLTPLDIAKDAVELFANFANESETWRWTYQPYGPFESAKNYAEVLTASSAISNTLFYTIRRRAGGPALGLAAYVNVIPQTGCLELGHLNFSPQLERTRSSTEALFLLLRNAFDDYGYRRCGLACDSLNDRARSCASRLGMVSEGIVRQDLVYKGRNQDTALYSVLNSEWPALDSNIRHWLRADNFSAEGVQRSRLSEVRAHSARPHLAPLLRAVDNTPSDEPLEGVPSSTLQPIAPSPSTLRHWETK